MHMIGQNVGHHSAMCEKQQQFIKKKTFWIFIGLPSRS